MSDDCQTAQSLVRAIRPLKKHDVAAVIEIERQGYSHPWSEAVLTDCFRADYRLWALEQEDQLIGYAIVAYMVDEAHLLNLCIAPAYRGQGNARYLLKHLVGEATHDRMQTVLLEVRESNHRAASLYLSEGFAVIGQRPGYYPAAGQREAAQVMALSLAVV